MARSRANDPVLKHRYAVSIPGLPSGVGFSKVSGLSAELGVVEYAEGGYTATHKLVGKQKVEPVTLERGMFKTKEMETLYKKSLSDPNFRTTVVISLQDNNGSVVRTWKLAEAWVSKWEGTDLDASSEDVAIEKITIEFEYYL